MAFCFSETAQVLLASWDGSIPSLWLGSSPNLCSVRAGFGRRLLCFGAIVAACLASGPVAPSLASSVDGWSQLGGDITSSSSSWTFGYAQALSGSGNRLVAAGPTYSNSTGRVQVFDWDGSGWVELGDELIGQSSTHRFGHFVSISEDGDRIAVSSPGYDSGGSDVGLVQVFAWDGLAWTQAGAGLVGEAAQDEFGLDTSLSADGERLAVGTYRNDGAGEEAGHVRVFEWDGSDWTQLGDDIDGENEHHFFGESVALSDDGSRLVAGATQESDCPYVSCPGQVRVFDWNGTAWVQVGDAIQGEAKQDEFGESVAISGDGSRVIVGAPKNDNGNASDSRDFGHARVFEWDGAAWVQVGDDIEGCTEVPCWLGKRVDISNDGTRVAVQVPLADTGISTNQEGRVRIFDWDGASWNQIGADLVGVGRDDNVGPTLSTDGSIFSSGQSYQQSHVRVFGPPVAPTSPTISLTEVGNASVSVTWNEPDDNGGSPITSYQVTATPGSQTCTTDTGTSCVVTGLTNNDTYSFTVTASNAAGTSGPSAPQDATPTEQLPSAPLSVSGSTGDESVVVTWSSPDDDGGSLVTSYTATASPGGQECYTASSGCTIDGLGTGTTYSVSVTASNAVGTGAASSSVDVLAASVPSAPLSVSGSTGDESVVVTWSSPDDDGGSLVTSYTATASPGGQECSTASTSCTIDGLTNGTMYSVSVTASNAVGTGAASSSVDVLAASVPSAPLSVSGSTGDESVVVTWSSDDDGGSLVTSYTATASPGGQECSTASTSCTIDGLTNGTTYSVSVTASNAVGTGAASSSVDVLAASVPSAPLSVSGSTGDESVVVTWSSPDDDGGSLVTSYTATASPGGQECSTASTSCTIDGLTNGTTYSVSVTASKAVGTGAASSSVDVIPQEGVSAPEPDEHGFDDVPTTGWRNDAVTWMRSSGVTTGCSATNFCPDNDMTREQQITFLWRYADQPSGGPASPFADVPTGRYFTEPVTWAYNSGITNGIGASRFGTDNRLPVRRRSPSFGVRLGNRPDRNESILRRTCRHLLHRACSLGIRKRHHHRHHRRHLLLTM